MPANPHNFQNAGDFTLDGILVVGSSGQKINIQNLVREINIYQSIDAPFISGNMMISDAEGVTELLPFLGQERLLFELKTPGRSNSINFNKYNAIIYNMETRFHTTDRMQSLVLNFTTLEHYKNIRTKISKSFKGTISEIVQKILSDTSFLGTKKGLNIEKTKNNRKYVIPNLNPFQAINLIKEEAVNAEESAPHYLFYENQEGFHFRSLDSLLGKKQLLSVPHKAIYKFQPPDPEEPAELSSTTILNWEVEDNTNHFLSTKLGMFGSTLYCHDIYNKNIQKYDFDYRKDSYNIRNTTDQEAGSGSLVSGGIISDKKTITEFPDSKIFVHPNASDQLHSEGTDNNAKDWLQESRARQLEKEYFTLKIETYGNTEIMVGDIIDIVIPTNRPLHKGTGASKIDNILSGRYLITSLHHKVSPTENVHNMTITVMKNSVRKATPVKDVQYPEEPTMASDIGLSTVNSTLTNKPRKSMPPTALEKASAPTGWMDGR